MNPFKIYKSVQDSYDAMLQACCDAVSEIIFEQYILNDYYPEGIAGEFIEILMKKARAGVRVILYLDAIGSLGVSANPRLREKLVNAGVELEFYESTQFIQWISLPRIFLRNHRKALIIDEKITFMGGVVIGDEYRGWDDLLVRIKNSELASKLKQQVIGQINHYESKKSFEFKSERIGDKFEILTNSPGFNQRHVTAEIHRQIKASKQNITIITPYFSPTHPAWLELKKARFRGVRVDVVIPESTDHSFIDRVHQGYFSKLLNYKVNVYQYPNMMHGKLIIIDDWATWGSTNFDQLSFIFNHELNLATTDKQLDNLKTYADRLISDSKLVDRLATNLRLSDWGKIQLYKLARIIT